MYVCSHLIKVSDDVDAHFKKHDRIENRILGAWAVVIVMIAGLGWVSKIHMDYHSSESVRLTSVEKSVANIQGRIK